MVGSQIAIANVLADLNLAVWYGIAIRIYASKKFWRILIWRLLMQTAKPPNLIPHQIFRLYGITNAAVEVGGGGKLVHCAYQVCMCVDVQCTPRPL